MALGFKVLEKFSREAREEAASRVYDIAEEYGYVCERGDCVMAVLLRFDNYPLGDDQHQPSPAYIGNLFDFAIDHPLVDELVEITTMNDRRQLATPEAVRALLLGEEA